jgi:putative membrane protein
MSRSAGPLAATLTALILGTATAQTPPPSTTAPRPAHAPDAAADENEPAGNQRNPADGRSPPLNDPLKQEAVQDPPPAVLSPATRFTTSALMDGMTEVRMGRLGSARAHNQALRELSDRIVSDHERINGEINTMAASRSITGPTELDADSRTVLKTVGGLHGEAFDRTFIEQMLSANTKAIALFTAAMGQSDADIASLARRSLPSLKSHGEQLRMMQKATGSAKS